MFTYTTGNISIKADSWNLLVQAVMEMEEDYF